MIFLWADRARTPPVSLSAGSVLPPGVLGLVPVEALRPRSLGPGLSQVEPLRAGEGWTADRDAAVDDQHVPIDIARRRGAEPEHGPGDLDGVGAASGW